MMRPAIQQKRTKMTGRELVNMFYQPLGLLQCHVSTDAMWSYAKLRALEVANMMLAEHAMYMGDLNPKWQKWDTIKKEIAELP